MKVCAYCGHENDDGAMECHECGGTDFRSAEAPSGAGGPPPLPVEPPPLPGAEPVLHFEALKPEEINNTWVTLLRCQTLVEADVIATRLEAAEIPVFVPDQFLMQAISWNVNTYGFVRLQVPPALYHVAREVLAE